jgi:hypothetical protein
VRIHKLVSIGYERLGILDLSEASEEEITGLLVEAIRNVLDSNSGPHWGRQFSVHEELPVTGESRPGRSRPRIDFVMEVVTRRPRPRFPFEAKRLYRSDSVAEYVGVEGLRCFITGTYPTPMGVAGMVGYVQDGTPTEWLSRIAAKLDQAREDFRIVGPGTPVMVSRRLCDALPDTHVSVHVNAAGELEVFHSFLSFVT